MNKTLEELLEELTPGSNHYNDVLTMINKFVELEITDQALIYSLINSLYDKTKK